MTAADSAGVPWAGRDLRPSPFAGDDGAADPALERALRQHAAGDLPLPGVVAAVATARLLVPVLAELEEGGAGEHGHDVDKEASAGVVALQAPDGRTALPVFSSVATMAAWRADARPVPVEAARAALSAVTEGWALLVVDPAGPVSVLLPRPAVWALAQQQPWRPAVTPDGVEPDVAAEVASALAGVLRVAAVALEPGRRAEVAVVLSVAPGLDRHQLDGVLAEVNARLAANEVVAGRVDSLELRVRAAG